MPRQPTRPRGLPPAALATLTVVVLTGVFVAVFGVRQKGKQASATSSAARTEDEAPVDPFASLPREEWDPKRRQTSLVTPTASDVNEELGAMPVITGEGWTAALEAGRLADEELERAKALRGEVDIDTYKASARRAKALYERALELGTPILEAMGDEASGTGVERRMSRWTGALIALKKTTGL